LDSERTVIYDDERYRVCCDGGKKICSGGELNIYFTKDLLKYGIYDIEIIENETEEE